MNRIREARFRKYISLFAPLTFLLMQVPVAVLAATETRVAHDAIGFFVAEKRIRLEALVDDPKGVKLVRAYFKARPKSNYLFVPMENQPAVHNGYVAILPALAKSDETLEYLFLVVNGANEVIKSDAFVVKAKDTSDVPKWQMVKDNGPMQLFTEVADGSTPVPAFPEPVSVDVTEAGLRYGVVAQLYGASANAALTGAAATASNAGASTVATTIAEWNLPKVWQRVSSNGNENCYAAPKTISQQGNMRVMWELRDYQGANQISANGNVYMSELRRTEYDCKARQERREVESFFDENMSKGKLLDSKGTVLGGDGKWIPVRPNTTEATMMGIACKKPDSGMFRALIGKLWPE